MYWCEKLLAQIGVDTAGAGCNTCLSELLLGLVLRNAWGGSREQTTVEAPAGVTTLGTRALAVGLGDRRDLYTIFIIQNSGVDFRFASISFSVRYVFHLFPFPYLLTSDFI